MQRSFIRESKTHQINGVLQTSAGEGMISMDAYILSLFEKKRITRETAISYAANPEQMAKRV